MKGVLNKDKNGWNVIHSGSDSNGKLIPLHPNQNWWLGEIHNKPGSYKDGDEIEFDLIESWVDLHPIKFAKVVLQTV